MHQALFVEDILVEIFSHLKGVSSSTPWCFAALARICKAFYDPAMDLLWADMEDLEPLLGCVTRLHPLIYGPKKQHFDRSGWSRGVEPLSEYEARQFVRHAARVRSLQMTDCVGYEPLRPW
ncbi:hypothetical protein AZE42_07186, partial [Rhizopogon vesiculosus]